MSDILAEEVKYLTELFRRKLLEDKSKKDLISSLQQSLSLRDELDKGIAFGNVFNEALLALDRLREEEPTKELVDSFSEELLETFARRGLRPIPDTDQLDPRIHEVVETIEISDDFQSGDIVNVVRDGYFLGDRLLRPARVVVAMKEK